MNAFGHAGNKIQSIEINYSAYHIPNFIHLRSSLEPMLVRIVYTR